MTLGIVDSARLYKSVNMFFDVMLDTMRLLADFVGIPCQEVTNIMQQYRAVTCRQKRSAVARHK